MRKRKEKKAKGWLSSLKLSPEEETTEETTEVTNEEINMDLAVQEEEVPATPLQMFLLDTYSSESYYLLLEVMKTDELISMSNVDPHRGLQKKIKLGCILAKALTDQFQEIGVTKVTLPMTTAPRVCVANHYKDVLRAMLKEQKGSSVSEVSFDIFDDGITDGTKNVSYLCTFTAYFMIKCSKHWNPLLSLHGQGGLREEALEKLDFNGDDTFVLRIGFKMLYAFSGPANASFTKDGEVGLKNIMINGANYIVNDIIHKDETIRRLELNADRILEDNVIFKEVAEYKNNYGAKVTWRKSQHTMFDPDVNRMAICDIEDDGTITGNVDYSDDITQLMYKF